MGDITETLASLNGDVATVHTTLSTHKQQLAKIRSEVTDLAAPHVHDMYSTSTSDLARLELSVSTLQKQLGRKVDRDIVDSLMLQAVEKQSKLCGLQVTLKLSAFCVVLPFNQGNAR